MLKTDSHSIWDKASKAFLKSSSTLRKIAQSPQTQEILEKAQSLKKRALSSFTRMKEEKDKEALKRIITTGGKDEPY